MKRLIFLWSAISLIFLGSPSILHADCSCEDGIEVSLLDGGSAEIRHRDGVPTLTSQLKYSYHVNHTDSIPTGSPQSVPSGVDTVTTWQHHGYDFKIDGPLPEEKRSKPIIIDYSVSGGGEKSEESANLTLKFPGCYRKFRISTKVGNLGEGAWVGDVPVGLEGGYSAQAEIPAAQDDYASTEATVQEVQEGDKTWIYLTLAPSAHGSSFVESLFIPDVKVVLVYDDSDGNSGTNSGVTGGGGSGGGGGGGGSDSGYSSYFNNGLTNNGGYAGVTSWSVDSLSDATSLTSVDFGASAISGVIDVTAGTNRKQLYVIGKVLVDVVKSGSVLTINYYDHSDVGSKNGDFYSLAVSAVSISAATITDNGNGTVHFVTAEGGVTTGDWTLGPGSGTIIKNNLTNRKTVDTFDDVGNGDRTETHEVWVNDSGTDVLDSKTVDVYHTYSIDEDNNTQTPPVTFERQTSYIEDPAGAALTTNYGYGVIPGLPSYQKRIWTEYPDGNWVWEQYDGLDTGVAKIVWMPFKDAVRPPNNPPTDGSEYVKQVYYTDGHSETSVDGKLISKQTPQTIGSNPTFLNIPGLVLTISSQWTMPSETPLQTVTYSYAGAAVSPGYLSQRPYAVILPDRTCSLYSYDKGTYNPSTGAFQSDPQGADLKTTVIHCAVTGTDSEAAVSAYKDETVTIENADGWTLEEQTLWFPTGQSTPTWVATQKYGYDAKGNLKETKRITQGDQDWVTTYSANYDPVTGDMVDSTDEFGVVTTYDEDGLMSTATSNDGEVTITSMTLRDLAGRVVWESDGTLETSYVYETGSGGGRKVTTYLPSGQTSITEYYRSGRIKSVSGTGAIAHNYNYTSTASGTLTTFDIMGAGARTILTVADMMGRPREITRPKFGGSTATTVYEYNEGTGQLTSISLEGGTVVAPQAFTYLFGEQQLSGYDMDGNGQLNTSSSSADRVNYLHSDYVQGSGKWYSRSRSGKYLPNGTLQIWQEVWSRVDGRETIVKGPGDRQVTTTLAVLGNTVTATTVDSEIGAPSVAVYKGNRTLVSQREPWQGAGQETTYEYNSAGQLWKETDALNRETIYTYQPQNTSGAGQVQTITLPGGASISRTYTPKGQLDTEAGTGTYWKKFAYNEFGEITGMATQPDTTPYWTNWQRDPGTGLIAKKSYGNTSSAFQNNSTVVNYNYDLAGQLKTRTWARGITTTYGYTPAGELASITYSDGTPGMSPTSSYDKAGRLTAVTDASGARTISYSNFDQRANETWTSGLLSGYGVNRTYAQDRRTGLSATGPSGFSYPSLTYTYDPTTLRLSGLSQGSLSVAYTPATGMLQPGTIAATWSGGSALIQGIGHDALGRTTYATATVGATMVSAHGTASNPIGYDDAGRRQTIPREDGSKWTYGYNTRDEVTSGGKTFSDGTTYVPGHQFSYVLDGIGNRKQAKWGGDQNGENLVTTTTLRTAALNQYSNVNSDGTKRWITGEAAPAATVVVNDGPTWRNGGFFGREIDQGNASGPAWKEVKVKALLPSGTSSMVVSSKTGHLLVAPKSTACHYDADGNLTSDGLWTYTWDGENRLKEMTGPVFDSQRTRVQYDYDFEGRRVQKKRYVDVANEVGTIVYSELQYTTKYIYDGWNLIGEVQGGQATSQRQYVWGLDLSGTLEGAGGVGGLLAMKDLNAGKSYFYASDVNGNVTALVDAANGSVAAKYEYGPFGEPLRVSGIIAKANPFRWSSKYTENESGLVYYGYRFYKPDWGRWINRDPIEEGGGANLYAMVDNNSVDHYDYKGLISSAQAYEIKLSYRNIESIEKGKCGQWSWKINWQVSGNKYNGYILQNVTITYGQIIYPTYILNVRPEVYSEAWLYRNNSMMVSSDELGIVGEAQNCSGSATFDVEAYYYEGSNQGLPPGFDSQAEQIPGGPTSKNERQFPYDNIDKNRTANAGIVYSNRVHRRVEISWDCTKKLSKTKVKVVDK